MHNTLNKKGYASCGLTKEEQCTQTYEHSGNSGTCKAENYSLSVYCNCECFTTPHSLYIKKQVLKTNKNTLWNVIHPLASMSFKNYLGLFIKDLSQVDQKLALSWKWRRNVLRRLTSSLSESFSEYILKCKNQKQLKDKYTTLQILDVYKGPIVPKQQKAACWTSAIHSHEAKVLSRNTDLLPIHMYFKYSLNYTILFISDLTKQTKTAVMTTEGSSVCSCNSSGNISSRHTECFKITAYIQHNLHHK